MQAGSKRTLDNHQLCCGLGETLIHLSLGVLVGDPEELVLHERLQKDLVSMRTVLHDGTWDRRAERRVELGCSVPEFGHGIYPSNDVQRCAM